MLLRKFREIGPDVMFLIFILMILSWMGAFISPSLPAAGGFDDMPMPLFKSLAKLTCFSPFACSVSAFLIMMLIAVQMVTFNTNAFFISERTFLPALVYVLLIGLNPAIQCMNPALVAVPFLILGLSRIMDAYKVQGTAYSLYDAGVFFATGSLFYASMIWFGILLIIAIVVLRPINPRELIISIAGLATPLLIFGGFYYVMDFDMDYLVEIVKYNLFFKDADGPLSTINIIVLIIAGVCVLVSVTHLLKVLQEKKIKSRKAFTMLFWTFIISAGMYVILRSVALEISWISYMPPAYFLSHYFVFSRRKKIAGFMFVLLLILVAVMQVVTIAG